MTWIYILTILFLIYYSIIILALKQIIKEQKEQTKQLDKIAEIIRRSR